MSRWHEIAAKAAADAKQLEADLKESGLVFIGVSASHGPGGMTIEHVECETDEHAAHANRWLEHRGHGRRARVRP